MSYRSPLDSSTDFVRVCIKHDTSSHSLAAQVSQASDPRRAGERRVGVRRKREDRPIQCHVQALLRWEGNLALLKSLQQRSARQWLLCFYVWLLGAGAVLVACC